MQRELAEVMQGDQERSGVHAPETQRDGGGLTWWEYVEEIERKLGQAPGDGCLEG